MKFILAVLSAIIAGVVVFYITGQDKPPQPPPRPPTTVSKPAYDPYRAFMSAATSDRTNNPLEDERVQSAISKVLRGGASHSGNVSEAKKLLAMAGWPNGFSVQVLVPRVKSAGGSEGEIDIMATKLSKIGIRVHKVH